MRKALLILFLALLLLPAGCKAFRMSPDAWLDPQRWEVAQAVTAAGTGDIENESVVLNRALFRQ
jgi:hypothetical protein